jgi:hypothetical protein
MRPGPAACTGISGAEQWDRGCGRAGDGGASGGSGVREQGAELGERSRGRRQNGHIKNFTYAHRTLNIVLKSGSKLQF